MKQYFSLQIKLTAKQFPFVLTVTLVLLLVVGILFFGVVSVLCDSNTTMQYTVGITGDTDNTYMQFGFAALQSIEAERFSISLVELSRDRAQKALENGEIAAYVIIPEGFMENALVGELTPVTYVTSAGLEGVATMLKKEITYIVTDIVVQSQKGAFGLKDAMEENQVGGDVYDRMTDLSLQYTDLIVHRDTLFSVNSLGVSDGLSTQDYYLCVMIVLLLSLVGIPFAIVYIRKDYALPKLLLSRGYAPGKQLFCEFSAYLLNMLVLSGVVLLVGAGMIDRISALMPGELPRLGSLAMRIIPVVIMLTAMNMLIFTCSNHLVSGLLLHFFIAIGLCYISGCFYPIYIFPKALWPVAESLPTGLARHYIAAGFGQTESLSGLVGLLLYAVGFYGVTLWVRTYKTAAGRG